MKVAGLWHGPAGACNRRAAVLKGTVLWSLRLDARDHALVAEVCRAAFDAPGGEGRRRLRDPVPADAAPFAL